MPIFWGNKYLFKKAYYYKLFKRTRLVLFSDVHLKLYSNSRFVLEDLRFALDRHAIEFNVKSISGVDYSSINGNYIKIVFNTGQEAKKFTDMLTKEYDLKCDTL